MKPKFISLYNEIAHSVAKMSYARRLQVGAIIVKDDRVISMGYNGMPSGWDNNCEDVVADTYYNDGSTTLKTRPEVLHAESNALSKLARSHESGLHADMFITHSPCMECAKLIFQSGIKSVFYKNDYRNDSGIKFLRQSGVQVTKYDTD